MEKYTPELVKSQFNFSIPLQVRYSDIDGYLHVNNGIYFNYLEHARAMFLYKIFELDILESGTVVASVQIDFYRPIHILDKPDGYVRCIKTGTTSFVLEQILMGKTESGKDQIFAKATTTMVFVDLETMKPKPIPEAYRSKLEANPQNHS